MNLTRRERLKRCYFYQELDRPAVYSRTGFPKDDPTYDDLKKYIKEHSALKIGWPAMFLGSPPEFETRNEAYSDDFEKRIEVLQTPAGPLQQSCLLSLIGQPGMIDHHLIDNAEEAEKYLSLPPLEFNGDASSFFTADTDVGDAGIVDVGLGYNPAGQVAGLCGSEVFAMMSITDRDVLHAMCERNMNNILNLIKFLHKSGVGPFFSMLGEEYLVPPLHGPEDFRDFNVRYDKPIIDLVHDCGGRIHIHSHGFIKSVMQDFVDMGVDVLHPCEPPPQGNILAHEAKAIARGKTCIEGNIQIHRMYEASPEDIRAETEQLIADAFDDHKGLIVSTTASPYIRGKGIECLNQYKAMIDTVLAL